MGIEESMIHRDTPLILGDILFSNKPVTVWDQKTMYLYVLLDGLYIVQQSHSITFRSGWQYGFQLSAAYVISLKEDTESCHYGRVWFSLNGAKEKAGLYTFLLQTSPCSSGGYIGIATWIYLKTTEAFAVALCAELLVHKRLNFNQVLQRDAGFFATSFVVCLFVFKILVVEPDNSHLQEITWQQPAAAVSPKTSSSSPMELMISTQTPQFVDFLPLTKNCLASCVWRQVHMMIIMRNSPWSINPKAPQAEAAVFAHHP